MSNALSLEDVKARLGGNKKTKKGKTKGAS